MSNHDTTRELAWLATVRRDLEAGIAAARKRGEADVADTITRHLQMAGRVSRILSDLPPSPTRRRRERGGCPPPPPFIPGTSCPDWHRLDHYEDLVLDALEHARARLTERPLNKQGNPRP